MKQKHFVSYVSRGRQLKVVVCAWICTVIRISRREICCKPKCRKIFDGGRFISSSNELRCPSTYNDCYASIVCDPFFLLNIAVGKFVNIRLQHEQFITSLNNSKPEESYFQQKTAKQSACFFVNESTLYCYNHMRMMYLERCSIYT
jgi:hypothetical protein